MNTYFDSYKLQGTETNKLEKIRFILANVFLFFLPYDDYYSTIIFYLLIGTILIDFKISKLKSIPKQFWIFQLVFLLSVVGYFNSNYKSDASSFIERQLVIFLFPLLLPLTFEITKERLKTLLYTLTISSLCIIIILYAYAFFQLHTLHLPIYELFSKPFLNHNFSQPIGIHAGYLSFYLSIGVFFLMQELILIHSTRNKIIIFVSLLCLLLGLFSLVSRSVLLAVLLVCIIVFPLILLKKRKSTLIYFLCLIPIFAISLFFIRTSSDMNTRIVKNAIVDLGGNSETRFSNIEQLEPRVKRWGLGLELVKQKPILGYGTGAELPLLKEKYLQNNLMISYYENFNSHNGYLSIMIKHGVLGLCVFLFSFYYVVRLALIHRDFIYLSFILTLLIFLFTENVLDRQKGIFLFAFLNTLFGYYFLNQRTITKKE